MNRLLTLVFAERFGRPGLGASLRRPIRPGCKLSSANVLVLDAAADRQIYAKAADDVTPIASVTKLMTAMVVLDASSRSTRRSTSTWAISTYLKGSHSRLRMGSDAVAARNAAARADVVGKPRGVVARAPLSRRHARVRRRDELQGRLARHDAHALFGSDRTVARKTCRRRTISRSSCRPPPSTR